ncbi:peptidoglycan binding domain protein, partial [Trichuris suis]
LQNYLEKYKYIDSAKSLSYDKEALSRALRRFQHDAGLNPDGILNLETFRMMLQPRCGNPSFSSVGRRKRFVPHGAKWLKRTLTWKLDDPHNLLGKYEKSIVRTTLHRAFNDWSSASKRALRFSEHENGDGKANFNIFFARGDHNDSLPFDGRAGIVAHGFYPTNGNLHFDADEQWTLYMADGINLYQTAMHEIGHLLGLEHSNDYNAVMFPINRPYDPLFKLGDDDIRGIRYKPLLKAHMDAKVDIVIT